jgi:hypothetical protein
MEDQRYAGEKPKHITNAMQLTN